MILQRCTKVNLRASSIHFVSWRFLSCTWRKTMFQNWIFEYFTSIAFDVPLSQDMMICILASPSGILHSYTSCRFLKYTWDFFLEKVLNKRGGCLTSILVLGPFSFLVLPWELALISVHTIGISSLLDLIPS